MARQFKITDSEGALTAISFIDSGTFALDDDGVAGMGLPEALLQAVRSYAGETSEETWRFHSIRSSVDDAAAKQSALYAMLRKALRYEHGEQEYPVYLTVQYAGETNPRYAIIRAAGNDEPGLLTYAFEKAYRVLTETLKLRREHPWRGSTPGTLPSAQTLTKTDGSANKSRIWVQGAAHTQAVTHVFMYDDSLTSWSANMVAANDVPLFEVSGSTPAANDLMVLISDSRVPFGFVWPLKTAGDFTADIRWEAYISAAWTELAEGVDYLIFPATDPDSMWKATGEHVIAFFPGADWDSTTVNGVTGFAVRAKLNSVSAWTTSPVTHATETMYTPKKGYVDLPSTAVDGDAPPRVMFRLISLAGGAETDPGFSQIGRVLIGAKRGTIGDFAHRIPLHNYGLPSGWARTVGTDGTETADPAYPEGYKLAVDFSGDDTMVARLTLTGTSLLDDYKGVFVAIVEGKQIGGDPGDIVVRAVFRQGSGVGAPEYVTPDAEFRTADTNGAAVLDLGVVNIPPIETRKFDTVSGDLEIVIEAERVAGAGTLELSAINLLPIKDGFAVVSAPNVDLTYGSGMLKGSSQLDVDYGVLMDRAAIFRDVSSGTPKPLVSWLRSAAGIGIEPDTAYRFYFLLLGIDSAWASPEYTVLPGRTIGVEIYTVNSYLSLRGSG